MSPVASGVTQLRLKRLFNVYFVETGTPGEWVLVDTGLPGSGAAIRAAANRLFGKGARPQAILLTHGHRDHSGSALVLATHWRVPVLTHPLELPYLSGHAFYPPLDPTVGGFLAFVSRFFPRDLPDLRAVVQALPLATDQVPFLPGWCWLPVPGHAPGQVAFFRATDRTLLGGDAFATVDVDSLLAVLRDTPQVSRGGTPLSYDWPAARASVQQLAALNPHTLACGHGPLITGPAAAAGLHRLAATYPIPSHGRYVQEPARLDASGLAYLPPPVADRPFRRAVGLAIGLVASGGIWWLARR